jgi:serine/threonine protein kinase
MQLKRLQNVEPNAARLISKLLVKDPTERWSASKALNSQFFMHRDDTTKMAGSAASLQATMHTNFTSIHSESSTCSQSERML